MNRLSLIPEELIRIKVKEIREKNLCGRKHETPESDWQEAKQYLETHPREVWLWRLNRPFIWLEKSIIEPLDFWADRANIFSFFSKISPILEAIGVLLIPFAIFYFESSREERQIRFEQNLISAQTEVRHQEAVRDYLSQITTIYLETEQGKELQNNEELKILLEATTLALFDELSVSEDSLLKKDRNIQRTFEGDRRDRKGQVIRFLSRLNWINEVEGKEPLLSLQGANLVGANLVGADLGGANLVGADLGGANLRSANLVGADLGGANLVRAFLVGANLVGANLVRADLVGANLFSAYLIDTKNLTWTQIKSACFWEEAIYKREWNKKDQKWVTSEPDNTNFIEKLKKDTASNPKEKIDCNW